MSLTTRIEQDYIAAYKAKDALRLGVLRLLKTAAKNLQVELMRPVTDEELATVIQKQAKQRQDSIEQFTAANRPDLAEKEAAELSILKDYLPVAAFRGRTGRGASTLRHRRAWRDQHVRHGQGHPVRDGRL